MNRYRCGVLIAASIAYSMSSATWAQAVLPSDGDMRLARQRMEEALKGMEPARVANPLSVPKTDALPKPVAKSPDISQIAESYRRMSPPTAAMPSDIPELMVFVSFSMPKETLERIVAQSEKSGAVLVLRGLKGNSLSSMGEELAALVGRRNVTAIIHPPAFKQFKVAQVPALVIARAAQATKIGNDGCAVPTSYIKVDGDVGQDYALDLIERQAPTWAEAARRYSARLAGSRP